MFYFLHKIICQDVSAYSFGSWCSLGSHPLMPHYLGKLMAFQVKRTSFPILLSMWVTAMLTIMSLGAALG